jgi:hypothetical protein
MDQFPQMLYKVGGPEQCHGGSFSITTVDDAQALDAALADGWHTGTDEARAAHAAKLAEKPTTDTKTDDAPPTRAELEQKAIELGIVFSTNIGDAKLAERIAAKLAEKPGA